MNLPTFLKKKPFLIAIFIGTLALGILSVVGANLLKENAARQGSSQAQEAGIDLTTLTISPTSATSWPATITLNSRLTGCDPGTGYSFQYEIRKGDDSYYSESAERNPPETRTYHYFDCASDGTYSETFTILKEDVQPATSTPDAPTIDQSCPTAPCDYTIRARVALQTGGAWKLFDKTATFTIEADVPQPPSCDQLSLTPQSVDQEESVTADFTCQVNTDTTFEEVALMAVSVRDDGSYEGSYYILFPIPSCVGQSSCSNNTFVPGEYLSPGTYKVWLSVSNADDLSCTDHPADLAGRPAGSSFCTESGPATLTVTDGISPSCSSLSVSPTTGGQETQFTANLSCISGTSSFGKLYLVARRVGETIGFPLNITPEAGFCSGESSCQQTLIFKPEDYQRFSSAGNYDLWLEARSVGADGVIDTTDDGGCSDSPNGVTGMSACGAGTKTITLSGIETPACLELNMVPLSASVIAGEPITFTATFTPGTYAITSAKMKITTPAGDTEVIECTTEGACLLTTTSTQSTAVLTYTPTVTGQFRVKGIACDAQNNCSGN